MDQGGEIRMFEKQGRQQIWPNGTYQRSIPRPVASEEAPRSSQTYTFPDEIARRSSASSLRTVMGRRLRATA